MTKTFSPDIMVEIIKGVYSKIVRHPQELIASVSFEPESVIVSVYPHPDDMGSIIGREGKNIKAIRSLLASYALVNDDKRKIFIEVDCEEGEFNDEGVVLNFDTFEQDVKDLVEAAFKYTLEAPEMLKTDIFDGDRVTVVSITPKPEDVGRVIGRKGQNANAIKTFLDSYTMARNDKKKFFVEVKSPEGSSNRVEENF